MLPRQSGHKSECHDFYCDANDVCGESCAEIDIQEANRHAWHSTLHTLADHAGVGKGVGGGGAQWSGPRDWSTSDYGVGGRCIDTASPFEVAVSFPVDEEGLLRGMEVTLTQLGSLCPLSVTVDQYRGMAELSAALEAGMTPIVSYWSSNDLLWMDGEGDDGAGPCARDDEADCGESVRFYNFAVGDIPTTTPEPTTTATTTLPPPSTTAHIHGECASCPGDFDVPGYGPVSLVPTGWTEQGCGKRVDVIGGRKLAPHMGGRAYFADSCTAGFYDHRQYLGLNLLGKTMKYTVDLSGAGCGCNAAVYLVSMRQNARESENLDHYCDASGIGGEFCAEIDIQESIT